MRKFLLSIPAFALCLTTLVAVASTTSDTGDKYTLTRACLEGATVTVKTADGTTVANGDAVADASFLTLSITPKEGYYFKDGTTATKTASNVPVSSYGVGVIGTDSKTTETKTPDYSTDFTVVSGNWTQVTESNAYYTRTSGWKASMPRTSDSAEDKAMERRIRYTAPCSGTLTFDYAVNNGTTENGRYAVYLYVNGELRKTYDYYETNHKINIGTSDANFSVIKSESGITVAYGDTIMWGFKRTGGASEGLTAYIGNVQIAGNGMAAYDIAKVLSYYKDYAVHQHAYGSDGKCTTCSALETYTLSDYTTGLPTHVKSVTVTKDETTLATGATLTYGDEFKVTITPQTYAVWSDDNTLAAGSARTFDLTVGITDPNDAIAEKMALVVCPHTNMTSGVCDICGQPNAITAGDDGVYSLANVGDLMAFADIVNSNSAACAKLTADINVNDVKYTGFSYTPIAPNGYMGTFDGDGHTVTLNIGSTKNPYLGLFAVLGNCTVKNVTVAGTIAGSTDGNIQNSYCVGGIAGSVSINSNSACAQIINCHNKATVSGNESVGGIVGYAVLCTANITNCTNSGTITGGYDVGGIVGYIAGTYSPFTITKCINTGTVSGTSKVGGLVGYVEECRVLETNLTIKSCANQGTVTATSTDAGDVGALVSYVEFALDKSTLNIEGCYNSYTSTGLSTYTAKDETTTGKITVKNTYDFNTTDESADTYCTTDQVTSGALCYNLNGGDTSDDVAWRQTLSDDETAGTTADALPTLSTDSKIVYYAYADCQVTEKTYMNDNLSTEQGKSHHYNDNGFCELCDVYAALTEADMVNGVYQINNAGNLFAYADLVNNASADNPVTAGALVTADINLANDVPDGFKYMESKYSSIIAPYTDDLCYQATFDGGNHTITLNGQKLFGVAKNATIKNLTTAGTVSSIYDDQAAIVGVATNTTISSCQNMANVTGASNVGGIVGNASDVTIENCSNHGTISGSTTGTKIGSLVGKIKTSSTLTRCYNDAESSLPFVGSSAAATLTRCYDINSSTIDGVSALTSEQLKSGDLCYKLNGGITNMNWYQRLTATDNVEADAYPVTVALDDEANVVNCFMDVDGKEAAQYFNTGDTKTFNNSGNTTALQAAKFYVLNATPKAQESVTFGEKNNVNILVNNGSDAYTCANAILQDGNSYDDLPYDYTATKFTFTRKLTQGINSFILPIEVEASKVNGTVYKLSSYSNGTLVFDEVTGTLEANTPYLVKAKESTSLFTDNTLENVSVKAMAAGSVTAGDATHIGTYTYKNSTRNGKDDEFNGKTIYGYYEGKFYKATGTWTLLAFRTLIAVNGSSAVQSLSIDLGDETTAIDVIGLDNAENVDVYTLSGLKLRTGVNSNAALRGLPAGIYVVNGKKVVNK